MTFRLRVRARAKEDIRDARDWYEKQSAGLGDRFFRNLESVIDRLAEEPFLYQQVHRNVRRALTRRFPYAVYFIVEEDRITILRVLHHARDPEELRRVR